MKKCILSLLMLMASMSYSQGSELVINDAWIRAMPPSSRVVPIYLNIDNPTARERKLIGIEAEAGSIEIHQTIERDGMMYMKPVDEIVIAANDQVRLAPSGFHGMMSHFTQGVPEQGEKILLTLIFDNGAKQSTEAKVIKETLVKEVKITHVMAQ
ncbi:copper chaperone PCu(A)C [Shewanella surugensis]|uniref:Copper chaperone PCu(A)C n=1 Tax=Shewanella surugensis TaxID=212020 RepID=A0ABT0LB09_9GAMM|nr:copper chaperone PCu(A)C [Shewanella surugensis]MCL1124858.1 copper chaperone PCu(A)C [Shewanella surugensis]